MPDINSWTRAVALCALFVASPPALAQSVVEQAAAKSRRYSTARRKW